METSYFDELDKQADKDIILNNLPNTDKQLENLYTTIKCLQNCCIKINITPNLSWKDFMELYREELVPVANDKIEQILLGQSIQTVLRQHTAEYLDKLNPDINHVFEEILNFSNTFEIFYPELYRSIEERINGSQDSDYEIVIDELAKDIQTDKDKNDKRLQVLADFSNVFDVTLDDLGLLKSYASTALEDKKHEIKLLEDALKKLEDKLLSSEMEAINYSFITKTPLEFMLSKNKDKAKDKEKDKDEKEKQKKELKDKIAKLHAALSAYNQDYGTLKILFDAASQFRKGFMSIRKNVTEISQSWNSLDLYFTLVKSSISDENIKNHWVRDALLPKLKELNDKFTALNEEIKSIQKILPMDIVCGEENADGELDVKDKLRINNSRFLKFYVDKFLNLGIKKRQGS